MMTERKLIDVGSGRLEAFISDAPEDAPVICAAHPADNYTAGTAELLAAASGARVVSVNPRGVGGSDPAAGQLTLDEIVDDLDAVQQRLGIARWLFWGMSGGGWLAQRYAYRRANRLNGIVLESICACFRERLADPDCLVSPFHSQWRQKLLDAGLLNENSHAAPIPVEETEWIEVPGVGEVFRKKQGPALLVAPMKLPSALTRIMPELWRFDSREWIATIQMRSLVVCGSADPIVPLKHSLALARALPGAELLVVDGAGHVPTTEKRPEVGARVRALLASLG
jgi:3-oxoadipate enol-lactonase